MHRLKSFLFIALLLSSYSVVMAPPQKAEAKGAGGGQGGGVCTNASSYTIKDAGTRPSVDAAYCGTTNLKFNPKASVENAGVGHNIIIYDEDGAGKSVTFNVCNPLAGKSVDVNDLTKFWGHLSYLGSNPGAELSKDADLLQTIKDAAAVNDGTKSTNGKCGDLPADIANSSDKQSDRKALIQLDLNEAQWKQITDTGRAADYPQWFPVSLVRKDTGAVIGYYIVDIAGAVAKPNGQLDIEFFTDASLPQDKQLTPGEYNVQIFDRIFETITKTSAPFVDKDDEILDFQGGIVVDGTDYDNFYDWLLDYSLVLGTTVYPPAAPPAGSDAPIGAPDPVVAGDEEAVNLEPSCFTAGGFLSWVLCPVLTVLDETTQFLERQVQGFLFVDQQQFSRDSPIYQSWSSFRAIATVIIIIIAAVMIFSQAMGDGIFDNYSVKKLLPRLIIAGIGIQLSWFGMVLLIDIFNVLGDGIAGIMLNPFSPVNGVTLNADTNLRDLMGGLFETASAGDFFTGLASVTIGGIALVGAMIGLAIGAASALFVGFVTLIIRNMVIFIGVVFSPIAIAMSVLPGTQKSAKWWWESFEKALLMYPLVMALLSVGKILAVLLLGAAQSDSDEGIKMTYVMAAAVAWYGPFILFPKLASAGGQALGKISGFAGDRSKGMFDNARKWNDGRKDTMKKYKASERNARLGTDRKAYNPRAALDKITSGQIGGIAPGSRKATRFAREDLAAQGTQDQAARLAREKYTAEHGGSLAIDQAKVKAKQVELQAARFDLKGAMSEVDVQEAKIAAQRAALELEGKLGIQNFSNGDELRKIVDGTSAMVPNADKATRQAALSRIITLKDDGAMRTLLSDTHDSTSGAANTLGNSTIPGSDDTVTSLLQNAALSGEWQGAYSDKAPDLGKGGILTQKGRETLNTVPDKDKVRAWSDNTWGEALKANGGAKAKELLQSAIDDHTIASSIDDKKLAAINAWLAAGGDAVVGMGPGFQLDKSVLAKPPKA